MFGEKWCIGKRVGLIHIADFDVFGIDVAPTANEDSFDHNKLEHDIARAFKLPVLTIGNVAGVVLGRKREHILSNFSPLLE